jgi:hypothetical protein
MDIIFSHPLNSTEIARLNRCRVYLQALFLSDITTTDGKYLEHFVFDPGGITKRSQYSFPREQPSRQDWDRWINFWHECTTTGGKLKSPLGRWINPTHQIWHWYYDKNREALYHINGPTIRLFTRATGWRRTRSMTMFELKQTTSTTKIIPKGVPMLVIIISESRVNKLHEGPLSISKADAPVSFWTFINSWGGNWMWQEISNGNKPKDDMQWVANGMMAGTLIWTTDGSYDRKKAADLSGVGWIIFCKATGQ